MKQVCPRDLFRAVLVAVALTVVVAEPAFAATDHQLQFTFGGRGRNPSVATMKNYILGCLPAGTWTLLSAACSGVRPAKVTGVTVADG